MLDRIGWVTVWDPTSISPESAILRNSLQEHGVYFGGALPGMGTPVLSARVWIRRSRSSGLRRLRSLNSSGNLAKLSSGDAETCSLNQVILSVQSQSSPLMNELTTKNVAGK